MPVPYIGGNNKIYILDKTAQELYFALKCKAVKQSIKTFRDGVITIRELNAIACSEEYSHPKDKDEKVEYSCALTL